MLRSTEMRYRAACEVDYRFICHHCKYQTEWFYSSLEKYAVHRLESSRFEVKAVHNIKKLQKIEQKALEHLNDLIDLIKDMFDKSNCEPVTDVAIVEQFKDLFPQGKSCPNCRKRQMWYPAASSRIWRQGNINSNLEAVVGEPTVELMGAPDASEYVAENITDDIPTVFTEKLLVKDMEKEQLAYWHLRNIAHDNILYVQDVVMHKPDEFLVIQEQYKSVPLSMLLTEGIEEKDFQDYIMQLCDALEFLHSQKPSIAHNAILPQHILVGEGNLLKLSCFDEATIGDAPTNDIIMLGKLMEYVDEKYMKKYREVIDGCVDGYKTITDFRQDFLPQVTIRFPRAILIFMVIIMALLIISRRML